MWTVTLLSEADAQAAYSELWATAAALLPALVPADLARVVSLVAGTCGHCDAAPVGCQCWNDE